MLHTYTHITMEDTTRAVLFLGVCVPVRLGMAYLPHVIPEHYFRYFGILILTMACGTLYLAWTNMRLNALEGGGHTWWAPYRFVHGVLLLAASVYLLRKDRTAHVPLLIDALLGALLFFTVRVA